MIQWGGGGLRTLQMTINKLQYVITPSATSVHLYSVRVVIKTAQLIPVPVIPEGHK